MTENGYNEEEMKMVKETHKIWGQQDVDITATCIRVPVMRAHAESINLELERDMSEEEVGLHFPPSIVPHLLFMSCSGTACSAAIRNPGLTNRFECVTLNLPGEG